VGDVRWRALKRVRWLRFYTPRGRECGLEDGFREHALEGSGVIRRDLEGGVRVRGLEGSGVRERGLEGGDIRERGMDSGVLTRRQGAASSKSGCGPYLKCAAWKAASWNGPDDACDAGDRSVGSSVLFRRRKRYLPRSRCAWRQRAWRG
jgi:hypothetical protein